MAFRRPADDFAHGGDAKRARPNPCVDEDTGVHVIFAIDMSGSMRTTDARQESQGGRCISRWAAVFKCAREFVKDQADTLEREKAALGARFVGRRRTRPRTPS